MFSSDKEPDPDAYPMAKGIRAAYAGGEEDEAMEPRLLVDRTGQPVGRCLPGQPVIFYDIRGEREIELTRCFVDPAFTQFPTAQGTSPFATMIQYHPSLPVDVAFPPLERLDDTLCDVVGDAGLRQLKIVESEKAVHLEYFFNGKKQKAATGEERRIIPSLKGHDMAEQPEMKAKEVCEAIELACREGDHQLIIANFANVDVVGHMERKDSALRAVEAVDHYLGRAVQAAREEGRWVLVTADHGTVEEYLYPEGTLNTGHTSNPVPFIAVSPEDSGSNVGLRNGGDLTDVAPSVLDLLQLARPDQMTGGSLFEGQLPRGEEKRRVLLLILDGWGHREEEFGNLIKEAHTPQFDSLWKTFPRTTLVASGRAVGMPENAVGNSESGHLHLGAGRLIDSDRVRIDKALESGEFHRNEAFLDMMRLAKKRGVPLHLLGIVSFYSSHGSLHHLFGLLDLARSEGIETVYVHSLLGRRGERPESGARYIAKVEEYCRRLGVGKVVSVMGRFWALDREEHWDRVEKAYRCLAFGEGIQVKGLSRL